MRLPTTDDEPRRFLVTLSGDTSTVMDEVLERYKQGKFQKCLELLKLSPDTDDVVSDFVQENNELVCESIVIISQKNFNKIPEMQKKLRLFFDKVISMETLTFIPVHLKLTAFFNFVYWVLFYNTEVSQKEEELENVNKGLLRVLGRQISFSSTASISDKIINNIENVKNLMYTEDRYAVDLILELVTVTILYVIKLKKTILSKCVKVVSDFTVDLKRTASAAKSMNEFSQADLTPLCLFKFGFNKRGGFVSDPNANAVDNLYILESVLLFLTKDFKESLKSLQKTIDSNAKNLWHYLGVLNSYELKNWDLCLGFLTKSSSLLVQADLKARFYIMHGKLCGIERNHKEALKYYEYALTLSPESPVVYYYIGEEYGKMGIYDLMVENFEKLVKIFDQEPEVGSNYESLILSWIHPRNEISKTEALFALAVSYGLEERFQKATETFEELLRLPKEPTYSTKRIIPTPKYLTVLHEASIMNLLTGNLVRAEQLAMDAQDRFIPRQPPKKHEKTNSLLDKDVDWLRKTIHQELLESDLEPKQLKPEVFYPEEVIFGFPQNIIALLIISEIQKIQEIDDYKGTLSKIFSMFSSYLSSMYKKEEVSEDENYVWTLVKALAGKTCLRIAEVLTKNKDETNVEKMYKRALSCNKGDKDALYHYYHFLLKKGKNREALKLWKTFFKEEPTVTTDDVQSFSLRYFLTSKITKRDLEKIEIEIEFMNMDLS